MNLPAPGFTPENLERIYLGQPPLAGVRQRLPEDTLSDREYEVASSAAEDLNYSEIGERVDMKTATVRTHLHSVYTRLGIPSRIALAGFFPLDPEDPLLEGRTLGQLSHRELTIIQAISEGLPFKTAVGPNRNASTARTHISNASKKWVEEGNKSTTIVRIANAIRANYGRSPSIPKKKNGGFTEKSMGRLALPELVPVESRIRARLSLR